MTVYRNASVLELDPPRVLRGVDLAVAGGLFAAVGPATGGAAVANGAEMRDLRGAWVMPGLVCAHTHVYSALARGVTNRIPTSSTFVEQLQNLWWRLDRALDEESVRSSALVAALEAVSCGATTLVDHHASPSFIGGSLSVLREAFGRVGLRGAFCYEVTDRNGSAGADAGIEENLAFARETERGRRGGGVPLAESCIGAHAPFTLSDRTLKRLAAAAAQTGRGLHIHVAEDGYDPSHARHVFGSSVLGRLDRYGLLGPRSIVAHGVHLDSPDIELLNARDAFLVHNARSNMNNAVGYARRLATVHNVALGTDGVGADMLAETQAAYLKARDAGREMGPGDAAHMLARGNEVAARLFGAPFGRIEGGYVADFVVLDYDPPTPFTVENVAGHLVFGLSSRHVRDVVIGGNVVYADRRFPFDVAEIHERARSAARRLWERMDRL